MIYLGIDPGTAITGYGFIREDGHVIKPVAYGAISTPAGWTLPHRLREIYNQLTDLIAQYRPNSAAAEQVFFSRNARTALAVGHARGVVLLALAQANLPISEYTPAEVKHAVTGYGTADKKQVQEMVRMLMGLPEAPQPDDVADALAVAICHMHTSQFNQKTGAAS
jgi:crossover junction endodeoxyribonuclease RuvC